MFFCAGFLHCFLIVNQTEIGCEKQCKEFNAYIAGVSEHSFFDAARKLLERREKSNRSKTQKQTHDNGRPTGPKEYIEKRLYTDLFYNFTSKIWMNAHETYDHDNITFVPSTITGNVNSPDQCQRNLRGRPKFELHFCGLRTEADSPTRIFPFSSPLSLF